MSKTKIFLCILAIALGVFLFAYGEYDDSPGGQLLGAVISAGGVIGLLRKKKRSV